MARLKEIVIDATVPSALAKFWAAALDGYAVRQYDEAEIARLAALGLTPETDPSVMIDGPGPTLCCHTRREGIEGRGPVHLDLATHDRTREIARLRALGASVWREADDHTTVMRDPDGNVFCVVQT